MQTFRTYFIHKIFDLILHQAKKKGIFFYEIMVRKNIEEFINTK